MNTLISFFIVFCVLYGILYLISHGKIENFLPFYSSPPKRWGGRDLRAYPYIPKRLYPWNNSSYNYYYRPRALVGRI